MPVSLADVAARAGVSRATASRALNNYTRFAPLDETLARVRQVAEEIGYQPNSIARSLRSRRSHHIGCYAEGLDVHRPFVAEVMNGLLAGCAAFEQDLVIHSPSVRSSDQVYRSLVKGNLDALVVLDETNAELMARLAASEMPVITLATNAPGLPAVHVDGREGSRLLVEHLSEKGHQRILYHAAATSHGDADDRQAGFREAALQRGMAVTELRAVIGDEAPLGAEALRLLALPPDKRPTAIACFTDDYAYKAMRHCHRLGLRVPDDISLVGFDGMFTLVDPVIKLTTIIAPWAKAAETAVSLLMDALAGKEIAQKTTLPVELFIGDTT